MFATCIKGKEPRCVGELYSLFDKVSWKRKECVWKKEADLVVCGKGLWRGC